jgi:hypothetical protein
MVMQVARYKTFTARADFIEQVSKEYFERFPNSNPWHPEGVWTTDAVLRRTGVSLLCNCGVRRIAERFEQQIDNWYMNNSTKYLNGETLAKDRSLIDVFFRGDNHHRPSWSQAFWAVYPDAVAPTASTEYQQLIAGLPLNAPAPHPVETYKAVARRQWEVYKTDEAVARAVAHYRDTGLLEGETAAERALPTPFDYHRYVMMLYTNPHSR